MGVFSSVQAALRQNRRPVHGSDREQGGSKASALPHRDATAILTPLQRHDAILVPKYKLRPPNAIGKQVADWNDLLVLQTFNIAYDTGIFPQERHRVDLSGCYLFLACTGCRPAEICGQREEETQGWFLGRDLRSESHHAARPEVGRVQQRIH